MKSEFLSSGYFKKKSRLILSFAIFLLVIIVLGIPYFNWGFIADDFGNIFHTLKFKNLFELFTDNSTQVLYQPSNFIMPEQTSFTVFYRPLNFLVYYIQAFFWGTNPYGYFLVGAFFHAINSVLIFNILLHFVTLVWAFWGALFFAFHPSLVSWYGWVSAQPYFYNLLFFLLIIILLKKYLLEKRIIFYVLACFLYVLSLLNRETYIIMPVLVIFGGYFYQKLEDNKKVSNLQLFKRAAFLSLGFWICALSIIILRLSIYGFGSSPVFDFKFIIWNLQNRFYDFVTFAVELLGLNFISGGHQIIKGSLVLFVGGMLFWLFTKSSKKIFILVSFALMLAILWPALLRYYTSRYFYEALPLYILMFAMLFNFLKIKKLFYKKVLISLAYSFVFFWGIFLVNGLKNKESELHAFSLAIDQISLDSKINGKNLCFIGKPFIGAAQALWLKGVSESTFICYDFRTFLEGDFQKIRNKDVDFILKDKGFRIITHVPDKLVLSKVGFAETKIFTVAANKIVNDKIVDADYLLDEKFLDKELLVIGWDFEKERFAILGSLNKK